MDFFDNPDVLTSGVGYKGDPATFGELTQAVTERQAKITSHDTIENQLFDAFDKRDDELEKAGLGRLGNPFRRVPTPDEWDRIVKSAYRDQFDLTERIGKPWYNPPRNDEFAAAYFLRDYEEQLKNLQAKRPDLAHVIRADKSPLAEVGDRLAPILQRADEAQESRNRAYSWLNPYRVAEGTAANLIGSVIGQVKSGSPEEILSNFVGLNGKPWQSIFKNYLKAAASNMAVQAMLSPSEQAARAAVGLESGLGVALEDIAMSGVVGGVFDTAFRAPVRAINKARGVEGLGGIFRDAPNPEGTIPVPRPQAEGQAPAEPAVPTRPVDLDADLLRRATEGGDPAAMREVIDKLKINLTDEPELRGALAAAEREQTIPMTVEGVDDGTGVRHLSRMLLADLDSQEPLPRAPDALPEPRTPFDLDRAVRAAQDPEAVRFMDGARTALDTAEPGLSVRVEALIEAGHPAILDALDDAVKRARGAEDAAKAAEQFVKDVLSLRNEIGPERFDAQAAIYSGQASPLDVARAYRAMPDLIDRSAGDHDAGRMAQSLARLSDSAFRMVERGEASPLMAQVVSDFVDNPALHASLLDDLKRAGVSDPDTARRTLNDLIPPARDPDAIPLDAGSKMDDPAGPEAKAQVERLKAEYATEMTEHAAKLQARKAQVEAAAQIEQAKQEAIAKADAVRAAIEAESAIGGTTPVRVFTSFGDLPAEAMGDAIRGNAAFFHKSLVDYISARSDEARATAIVDMERAVRQQGIEGFYRDGTVWLAAYADNPSARYVHEMVHALVDAGQLTRAEVRELAALARKTGIFDPVREATYARAYADRGARLPELLDEEAAAHLLEAKRTGALPETVPAPDVARADGIVARIQAFMQRITDRVREAVGMSRETEANSPGNGATSPTSSILDQLLSGEIAKREGVARAMQAEDISAMAVRDGAMFALSPTQSRAVIDDEIRRIVSGYGQGDASRSGPGNTPDRTSGARFGRALDGVADPDLTGGSNAQGRSVPAASGQSGGPVSRLPVTDRLRNAVLDYISDRHTTDAIAARRTAQGFTHDAWHGTVQVFDTPNPFRIGRDFGFHVAIGKPDAANERLGHAVTFEAKFQALIGKLLGQVNPFNNPESKAAESSIIPLAVKAQKPLRLPDMIRWDDPLRYKDGPEAANLPGWLKSWVRDWFFQNNAYRAGDAQMHARMQTFGKELSLELERRGYDSIIYKNEAEAKGTDSLLVWDAAQVRSAFDVFDERAANDAGLRASDKYIEQDIREIANQFMQDAGVDRGQAMFAFAGSPVEPIRAYHGSRADDSFMAFDPNKALSIGVHFGESPVTADWFSGYGYETAKAAPSWTRRGADIPQLQRDINVWQDQVKKLDGEIDALRSKLSTKVGLNKSELSRLEAQRALIQSEIWTSNSIIGYARAAEGGRIVSVDLDIRKPLIIENLVEKATSGWHPSAMGELLKKHGVPITSDDMVVLKAGDDLPVQTDAEATKLMGSRKDRLITKERALANALLRQRIMDAGYDAIQYRAAEGPYSWAYIPVKPGTVRSATSGQAMFAFAGERAKTADKEALAKAKQMDSEGTDRTKIWTDTGWFKGVDGKWRFEIDDSGMRANIGRGDDALWHPALEAAYPANMADIKSDVRRTIFPSGAYLGGGGGPSSHGRKIIEAFGPNDRSRRTTAIHELQHFAQDMERFSRGGQPAEFSNWMNIPGTPFSVSKNPREAFNSYKRLSGEVEARAVQKRMDMTPEQRAARPPWLDYDVPESEQIVRFARDNDVKAMAVRPDGSMFAFAGEKANTADKDALAQAKKMEADGVDRDVIWRKTGWGRGADQRWRFEIDDSDSLLTTAAKHVLRTGKTDHGPFRSGWAKARDVITAAETYAAYPDLGRMTVGLQRGDGRQTRLGMDHRVGMYDADKERIVALAYGPGWARRILLHEQQHAIQETERFASGANPESLKNEVLSEGAQSEPSSASMKSRHDLETEAFRRYHQTAGEVESRLVEKRMRMTAEQRRQRPFWLDYDVPEDQQIVRGVAKDDGAMFALAGDGNKQIEQVWGPKWDIYIGQQYRVAEAGGDLSTMYDILSAKLSKASGIDPAMRAAMQQKLRELYDDMGPEGRAAAGIKELPPQSAIDGPMFALAFPRWPKARDVTNLEDVTNAKTGDFPIAFKGALSRRVVFSPEQRAEASSAMASLDPMSVSYDTMDRIVNGPVVIRLADVNGNKLFRVDTKSSGDVEYILQAPDGERIASAAMGEDRQIGYVSTAPKFKRQGYASLLYDAIERDIGATLGPSADMISNEAHEFWLKRAPDKYLTIHGRRGDERTQRAIAALRERGWTDEQIANQAGGRSMFALADRSSPDEVSRLTDRLSTLASTAGAQVPDLQARVTSALNLLATVRETAAERGIELPDNAVEMAQAGATRGLTQLLGILGPERTAQIADDLAVLTKDLPSDPQDIAARINAVLDQYFPEEPKMAANDNADLGPMSPVETEMFNMERMGAIMELIGVCRG